jgi:hypothetical protein
MTTKASKKSADSEPERDFTLQGFFFPESGKYIEAKDVAEANDILNKEREEAAKLDERKDGDGN